MSNEVPDYRISMLKGILFGPKIEHRAFSVYIDSKVAGKSGGEDITGRIKDCFGEGSITGNISGTDCHLEIKYGAEAIKNGAPEGFLLYGGVLRKKAYIGGFKLVGIGKEERFYNCNEVFGMKEFDSRNMLVDDPLYVSDAKDNSSWN